MDISANEYKARIFGANEYQANSRTHLVMDCQTVSDGHIHGGGGGGMELRNSGGGPQISVTRTPGCGTMDAAAFIVMDAIAKFDGGCLESASQ